MDKELAFLTASQPAETKDPWQTYPYFLCGIGGYALYLAWLLTLLASASFLPNDISTEHAVIYHVVFLGSYTCALLIGWRFTDFLSSKAGDVALVVAAALLCPLAPLLSLVFSDFSYSLLGWFCAGVGGAALLLLSSSFLCSLSHKKLVFFSPVCVASAALIFMGLIYLPDFARTGALSTLVIVAAGLLLYVRRMANRHIPFVSAEESKKRSKMSWKSNMAVLGNSLCIGFMLYCASLAIPFQWRFVVLGLAAIVSALCMAIDGYAKEQINEEVQLKLFLPCAVLGFLPMPFFEPWGAFLGCVVLVLVFTAQFITNIDAVSENVYLFKLSPVRTFSTSRICNLIGVLLGYVAGFIAFGYLASTTGTAPVAVLFILLAVLIMCASFFYQNRYPRLDYEEKDKAGEEGEKGQWMKKCAVFAQKINLSAREKEILLLLAKGHDSEYIQSKLFISQSTIKSHTYNIYKKAGIHSRKELLTAIECVDLSASNDKHRHL